MSARLPMGPLALAAAIERGRVSRRAAAVLLEALRVSGAKHVCASIAAHSAPEGPCSARQEGNADDRP